MTVGFRRSLAPLVLAVVAFASQFGHAGAQNVAPPDLERGRHLATALASCADCHGANLAGGRAFVRAGQTIVAANLTPGAGGIAGLRDADVRRAIRQGVRPDGTSLRVMPREYGVMTDADVGALIAYLRSLPPIDSPRDASAESVLPAAPAARSDLAADVAPPALSEGEYLATIGGCKNCHGADLAGALRPNGTTAPNITHSGLGSWSFTDFTATMRTGKTPAGHQLGGEMPWRSIGRMTDAELHVLYDYLQSQPAK